MHLAAGKPPKQEAVNGSESQASLCCSLARPRHIIQQPSNFGGRKVGIEQEPGASAYFRFVPVVTQGSTAIRGAPILPDNGIVDRLAGRLVPNKRGFPLVGDTDSSNIFSLCPG